jgi:hypothetical protein
MVQLLKLNTLKSYLMKQLIIFINRLVSMADIAINHKFLSPGSNAQEPVYAVVQVRTQPIRK